MLGRWSDGKKMDRTAWLGGNITEASFSQGVMGSVGLLACREWIA